MIHHCPKEIIDCVGECCLNIIKGNVKLNSAQKLRPRKSHLLLISSKKGPVAQKKKIFNQTGGALLSLLLKPLIGPVIGSIGRKMAIVPFKLWEDMKRWKEEKFKNLDYHPILMSVLLPVFKEIYHLF